MEPTVKSGRGPTLAKSLGDPEMNVTCPNCATVYRVDPAKVPEGGVRARCNVCSAVFAVRREGELEPVRTAPKEAAAEPLREARPAPPEPPRAEPRRTEPEPPRVPAPPS